MGLCNRAYESLRAPCDFGLGPRSEPTNVRAFTAPGCARPALGMRTLARIALLIFSVLTLSFQSVWSASEHEPQGRHARAVELARTQNFQPALQILSDLREQFPDELTYLWDYVLVLGWAGRETEAVALIDRVVATDPPVHVLDGLAKSARNIGQFATAETLYRLVIERQPDSQAGALGLVLTLADDARPAAATQALELLAGTPSHQLGLAYIEHRKGNVEEAVAHYQRLAASHTAPSALRRLAAGALVDLRDASLARVRKQGDAGELQQALATVEKWRRLLPNDLRFAHRHVVLLSWLERDDEAVLNLSQLRLADTPADVIEAGAKSARNLRRAALAESLYRTILERHPTHLQATIGLALTLNETERSDEALTALRAVPVAHTTDTQYLFALANVQSTSGDAVSAAGTYRRILKVRPDDEHALRLFVLTVADLGAPHLALSFAREHGAALEPGELRRLHADRAATQVRWGALTPPVGAGRHDETDLSLEFLDEAFAGDWSQVDLSEPGNRRLYFDRMVALRDKSSMLQVADAWQTLEDRKIDAPGYVQLAAGDALLYLGLAREARDVYLRVLAREPANFNATVSLFYAYVELDDFDNALSTIDALADSTPVYRGHNNQVRKLESKKLEATRTALMGRAFADELGTAEDGLSLLIARAPANAALRQQIATVHRWRGQNHRALREFDALLVDDPNLLGARLGRTNALLDLGYIETAGTEILILEEEFPEHKHVQRLREQLRRTNRPEFSLSIQSGSSTGGSFTGNASFESDAYLYSQPIAYKYRLFAHHRYAKAKFPEGTGISNRVGIGLRYTAPRLRMSYELSGGVKDHTGTGHSVALDLSPDDHWRTSAVYESSSHEVPLRGLNAGVRGYRVGLGAAYVWHESQRVSASYNYVDFTDGNQRHSLFGVAERRLISQPTYKMTGAVEVFTSRNSSDNVFYFSPLSDLSYGLVLRNDWRLFRRYQNEFHHRLDVGIGRYRQQGHDSAPTWVWSYAHAWRSSDFSVEYGVRRKRAIFDGTPEVETTLFGSLNLKL